MSNSANQSRRSSNSTQSGRDRDSQPPRNDRRQKAQSVQVETGRRRPSQQIEKPVRVAEERPVVKSRINSAPLVSRRADDAARQDDGHGGAQSRAQFSSARTSTAVAIPDVDAQDEDEVAGVVGAIRHFQPFQPPELSQPLPDINIAIIGSRGVGKSTFMQKALDLPFISDSQAVERKIGIDGTDYLLRLLEVPIDDVDIDDDETVSWPETIEDKLMPQIDGAVTLYDVQDRATLEDVPKMLNAIDKAGLPSLLVSSKCDTLAQDRAVDPRVIEQAAKRQIRNLDALQVSSAVPDSHKQGMALILQAIVASVPSDQLQAPSALRRRAQSTAVRSVSPRPPSERGHLRAASEQTGRPYKDQSPSRHDSSLTAYSSEDWSHATSETADHDMQSSFLFEESMSETSEGSFDVPDLMAPQIGTVSHTPPFYTEDGITFEVLVDRLLAQPSSKADGKFAAIFLALYRKFAAPGELLEAIAQYFDSLERSSDAGIIRTSNQLRVLAILELWIGTYPGDFAYPKTKQRIRTFVSRLAENRIFAAAAKMMSVNLDAVREDDDTNWAYCDKDRQSSGGGTRLSLSSTARALLDDSGQLAANGPSASEDTIASNGATSSHILARVESAQQQAASLSPTPRHPVTKIQWRLLMEQSDDSIARELTRIDWIMFCSTPPRDLVRHVSLGKAQKAACKNIVHVNRAIEHFNHLASWVQNYILLRDKPKHRALMLEKFMRIARKLRELNNYNALGAIIAGIKSVPVHRLAATRELIPPPVGKDWLKLEILMSPSKSHSSYRLAWENSSSERIPYLPLHQRDLVAAEAGNETFIGDEKEGRINWKKFEIMGEVVVDIQKAQGLSYKGLLGGKCNELVRELVLDVKLMRDEEQLFARSKQLEPSGTPAVGTTAKFKELFRR